MMGIAEISWKNKRYELSINGVLKAYTQEGHEVGKKELKRLAEQKGYKVKFV